MKRATSDRKIASNRKNAQKSTGPRSEAGRARSRRNALRHGLAIAVASNPAFSKEIDLLASVISRDVGQRTLESLRANLPKRRLTCSGSAKCEHRNSLNAWAIRASAIFHNSMLF